MVSEQERRHCSLGPPGFPLRDAVYGPALMLTCTGEWSLVYESELSSRLDRAVHEGDTVLWSLHGSGSYLKDGGLEGILKRTLCPRSFDLSWSFSDPFINLMDICKDSCKIYEGIGPDFNAIFREGK